MADQRIVDLIEDWQTGAFVVGLFAGAAFGFLAYSYLRYGQ